MHKSTCDACQIRTNEKQTAEAALDLPRVDVPNSKRVVRHPLLHQLRNGLRTRSAEHGNVPRLASMSAGMESKATTNRSDQAAACSSKGARAANDINSCSDSP